MESKNANGKNIRKDCGSGGGECATGNKGHAMPMVLLLPLGLKAPSVCSQQDAKVQSINGSAKGCEILAVPCRSQSGEAGRRVMSGTCICMNFY